MLSSYLVLDVKIAKDFHHCAEQTKEYPYDLGEMRKLRIQLQELCGITEIEAINVLHYRNVSDYIHKYNRGIGIGNASIEDKILILEGGIYENTRCTEGA